MSGRLITSHFRLLPAVQRAPAWPHVLHIIRVIISRRELRERDPRLLADVGLSRAEALAEAARAPWDTLPPPRRPGGSEEGRRSPTPLKSLRKAYRRYRSRQRIAGLDARTLKDIGVTFAEAEEEANKPFWRD